jgi:hypothetical protein
MSIKVIEHPPLPAHIDFADFEDNWAPIAPFPDKGNRVTLESRSHGGVISPVLHLECKQGQATAIRFVAPDEITRHPHLSWWWEPNEVPPDGNVCDPLKPEQGLQVLLFFDDTTILHYVWDAASPRDRNPHCDRVDDASQVLHLEFIVLRFGTRDLRPQEEAVNVSADYDAYIKKAKLAGGARLIAIGVQATCFKSSSDGWIGALDVR